MVLDVEDIKRKMESRKVWYVAQKAGITKQALYSFLRGDSLPSYDALVKLTKFFEDENRANNQEIPQ
jgi:DNA-binding phage protein